jgi:hypothetical protein
VDSNFPMRSWTKAIADVGLPSVIALVLVLFLIYNITATHTAMAAQLSRVSETTLTNERKLDGLEELIRISRQTCINTAADAGARSRCLE